MSAQIGLFMAHASGMLVGMDGDHVVGTKFFPSVTLKLKDPTADVLAKARAAGCGVTGEGPAEVRIPTWREMVVFLQEMDITISRKLIP